MKKIAAVLVVTAALITGCGKNAGDQIPSVDVAGCKKAIKAQYDIQVDRIPTDQEAHATEVACKGVPFATVDQLWVQVIDEKRGEKYA